MFAITPKDICRDYDGSPGVLLKQLSKGQRTLADFDKYTAMTLGDVLRPQEIDAKGNVVNHRDDAQLVMDLMSTHRRTTGQEPMRFLSCSRIYRCGSQWDGVEGPAIRLSSLAFHQDPGLLEVNFSEWCDEYGLTINGWPQVANPYRFAIDFGSHVAVVNSHVMSLTSRLWLSTLVNYVLEACVYVGFDGVILDGSKWQWTYKPGYYGTATQGDFVIGDDDNLLRPLRTNKRGRWLAAEIVLGSVPLSGPDFEHYDLWDWDCYDALRAWNFVVQELRRRGGVDFGIISGIRGFDHSVGGGPQSAYNYRSLQQIRNALGPRHDKSADDGWCTMAQARAWVDGMLLDHAEHCNYVYGPGELRGTKEDE